MRRLLALIAWAAVGGTALGQGAAQVVQKFDGTQVNIATTTFTVQDQWEVLWFSPRPIDITVVDADGHVVTGVHGNFKGSFYVPKGGTYYLQLNSNRPEMRAPWQIVVAQVAGGSQLSGADINPMLANPGDPNYAPPAVILQPGATGSPTVASAPGGQPFAPSPPSPPRFAPNAPPNMPPVPGAPPNAPPTASAFGAPGVPPPPAPPPAVAPPPSEPAPVVKLTEDQARAVVLIKGDKAEGTGFLVRTPDGPAVVTNIHVIADNPNLKVTTNTGAFVTVLSQKCASDRDLALLAVQDAGYSYLDLAPDISAVVQPGDQVITPGNSEGGGVMLNTAGKVLGIGPDRIEIDNPIYHGNSGGPVFHPKSGKVLGVVTYAEKVDLSDDLDKSSFANRNSAIATSMRYFALRVDTVMQWIAVDPRQFHVETVFLDQFQDQSRRLDAYLNSSDHASSGNTTSGDSGASAKIYLGDEKIMRAVHEYEQGVSGADTAQQIEAARSFVFELQGVADTNFDQIQNPDNFYPFDRERAHDEMEYRKALKTELDDINNNVDRIGHLPRSNN